MTATLSLLRLPPYRWTDVQNDPSGPPEVFNDLEAKTWEGKIPRTGDANHLPILPNPGFVRIRCLQPVDGPDGGLTVLPARPWGSAGTVFRLPKGMVVGGVTDDVGGNVYTPLAADGTFTSSLSAGGVFLGDSMVDQYSPTDAQWLLDAIPFLSNVAYNDFVGGDMLLVICIPFAPFGTVYLNFDNGVGPPPLSIPTAQWTTDAALLEAASLKYRKFRLKVYYTGGGGSDDTYQIATYSSMLSALTCDADFASIDQDHVTLYAAIKADAATFFGL